MANFKMVQEVPEKGYFLPREAGYGYDVSIKSSRLIDDTSKLGKALIKYYGENVQYDGETESVIEKVASGDVGAGLTEDQTATLTKLDGISSSASEIDGIADLNEHKKTFTQENGGYSWWTFPHAIRITKEFDDILIHSFVNSEKNIVAVRKNMKTNDERRFILNYDEIEYDEHNLASFLQLGNGKIFTVYALHNADTKLRYRISGGSNDIDFGDESYFTCSDKVTYSQIIRTTAEWGSRIHLFFRLTSNKWAYRYSDDDTETWSDEQIFMEGYYQYLRAVPAGYDVRLLIIGHPILSADQHIRYGKITNGGNISTLSGTLGSVEDGTNLPLDFTSFSKVYTENTLTTRLFDVSCQDFGGSTSFAFCKFSDETDCKLYVTKSISGTFTTTYVCDLGIPLEIPAGNNYYFNGAWFNYDDDKIIYVAREESGTYYLEIYETVDYLSWAKTSTIDSSTYKINRPVHPYNGGDKLIYNYAQYYTAFTDYYSCVKLADI